MLTQLKIYCRVEVTGKEESGRKVGRLIMVSVVLPFCPRIKGERWASILQIPACAMIC